MLLDFAFILPLILFALLGFRDGLVRKLVAVASVVAAMFLAQLLRNDLSAVLRDSLSVDPTDAPMQAYLIIFFAIVLIQSLLYRLFAKRYKIGGIADRIIGASLGLFEGMLVVSVVLVVFSLKGVPDRKTAKESRLYGTLISLAPRISDFATTALPEAQEKLEKITSPAPEPKESENVKYLKGIEEDRKSVV